MLKQVLPSITNEVLKQVVAEFDAGELITMREQVLLLSNRAPGFEGAFTSRCMMGPLLSCEVSDHIKSCLGQRPDKSRACDSRQPIWPYP